MALGGRWRTPGSTHLGLPGRFHADAHALAFHHLTGAHLRSLAALRQSVEGDSALGTAKLATFRVLTELARERRELTVAKF